MMVVRSDTCVSSRTAVELFNSPAAAGSTDSRKRGRREKATELVPVNPSSVRPVGRCAPKTLRTVPTSPPIGTATGP